MDTLLAIMKVEGNFTNAKKTMKKVLETRLINANKEIANQNEEKDKRAAELVLANKELVFQTGEKADRAAELVIADKELAFQTKEKADRASELAIANKELTYQNEEKRKRAAELVIANKELIFQNEEMEKKVKELLLAKEQIEIARVKIDQSWRYNQSLIEASTDPIITIDQDGSIISVNSAVEIATGLLKKKLLSTNFSELFTEPEKAKSYYQKVFEKGKAFNYELNLKHIKGFTTPVIYNAFVYSDNKKKKVGLLVASDDIKAKQKDEIVYLQINLQLLIEQRTRELMQTNKKLAIENGKNEYLGDHDYSTNLYNRRYFVHAFDTFIAKGCFHQGLMMIDINGLKIINDAYGHVKGDEAIKQVADLLLKVFDEDDVVARIGGDEFAILSPNKNALQMQDYKDKLVLLSQDIKIENIPISLAIGFEILNGNDKDIDDLLTRAEKKLYRHKITVGESIRNHAIKAILNTLTDKYKEEKIHSEQVSLLCKQIGTELGLSKEDIDILELAGMYHDIGKISIPDAILNKPGKLTDEEYEIIKTHTQVGYQILRAADEYSGLAEYALSHHERWDGRGYPRGLKGKDIPLFSRVINVADSFEAMTADRPYRKGMSQEDAVLEIKRCSGSQFDPEIAKLFLEKVLNYNE